MSKAAILGFGKYIPQYRIKVSEIAAHNHGDGAAIAAGLGVQEKSVPGTDEDTFTMAFEAANDALNVAAVPTGKVSAVFVGSESHPYAVKPTSGMLVSALKLDPFSHAADLEFACKAGTAALQIVDAMVRSEQITYGLAVGSDTAQGRPGDALEYTAAAGAAALVVGPATHKNAYARIDATLSYTTDTPDFWRAAGEKYPRHAGRFTGEPAYFHHVRTATQAMLDRSKIAMSDVDHVIFHMPNGKFPSRIAKEFGISKRQMEKGFVVPTIGNTYSACSLIGLVSVLQQAKKGERIMIVSYGSGSGCDVFVLTMLKDGILPAYQNELPMYLSYSQYLEHTGAFVH